MQSMGISSGVDIVSGTGGLIGGALFSERGAAIMGGPVGIGVAGAMFTHHAWIIGSGIWNYFDCDRKFPLPKKPGCPRPKN